LGAALRALALALALPMLAASATPAAAEVIPAERMARGIAMTQQQCAAWPLTVWVTVANHGYCVRYYMSTVGGEGDTPVVFLQGDRLGKYNLRTRQFERVSRDQDIDTGNLQRMAENLSKQTGTTAIYLARLGVEGSSGFHGHRKTWLELYVLDAALEIIKERYGYRGFHLAGQSGGAGLVAGLLILREDIGCAVPGAGRLALTDMRPRGGEPELELVDPIQEVALIASRRNTRVLVVTDPNDKKVPAKYQNAFVQALRRAGGTVEQFLVQAADDNSHAVRVYTFLVVSGCVRGKSRQEIMVALARLQERHLAAARERRQRQAQGQPQGRPVMPPAGRPRQGQPAPAPQGRPAPVRTASGTPQRPAAAPPAPAQPAPAPAPAQPAPPAPRPAATPPAPPRAAPAPPPRITLPVPARPAADPPPPTPSQPRITLPRTASGGSPGSVKPTYY
jgi:hypothetical protein